MKPSSFDMAAAKRTVTAIAERGVLGAVTFLTSILLGRWGGPSELGLFVIYCSIVFLAMALQESLILAPYSIFAAGKAEGGERRLYLGGVLADSALLSLIVAVLFLVGAVVLALVGMWEAASISLILAVAAPCILLREFARRVVYTDFRPDAALVISAGVGALQLALMIGFYAAGWMNAASSFIAMGASSLIGGVWWLAARRKSIEFDRAGVGARLREHWLLGRWMLAAQAGEIVRLYMLPWLLALVADEATLGIFAACSIIASLPTPLHVAISNLLVPRMAHMERRTGLIDTDRLVWQATAWLSAAMLAFSAVVIAVSAHIVPWIYGSKFINTQHTLVVLVIGWAITGATLPTARALLIINRPDQMFWSQMAGIAINLVLGAPLVAKWGAPGAAYAALVGVTAKGAMGTWWYVVGMRKLLAAENVATPARQTVGGRRDLAWASTSSPALAAAEEAI